MALNPKTLTASLCFFIVTGISFGIPPWLAMSQYTRKSNYNLEEQPLWSNYNNFVSIERSRFRVYNWRYVQESKDLPDGASNFYAEMMCHSFKHDGMIKNNNIITMTSDQGILDDKNSYEILNGKKNKIFVVYAGNEKEVNGKKYSLIIYDATPEKNIIAYVENDGFNQDRFTIKLATNDNEIISVNKKSKSSTRFIYEMRYIGNSEDEKVISPMTASLIFSQQGFKKGIDLCNRIFIPFFITSLVCFGLVIFILILFTC